MITKARMNSVAPGGPISVINPKNKNMFLKALAKEIACRRQAGHFAKKTYLAS
jgi:hypothetical protein